MNELLDELEAAIDDLAERLETRHTFTDEQLQDFVLKLLRKAINEHGIDSIKELIQEIEEPDNAGDEWKDE